MARARAARLCPRPDDADDAVQDAFLQAFIALNRLRNPDRFAGWLGGIVANVCRAQRRRAPLTLLGDRPENLHRPGRPTGDHRRLRRPAARLHRARHRGGLATLHHGGRDVRRIRDVLRIRERSRLWRRRYPHRLARDGPRPVLVVPGVNGQPDHRPAFPQPVLRCGTSHPGPGSAQAGRATAHHRQACVVPARPPKGWPNAQVRGRPPLVRVRPLSRAILSRFHYAWGLPDRYAPQMPPGQPGATDLPAITNARHLHVRRRDWQP
jgi:hypothetical protein